MPKQPRMQQAKDVPVRMIVGNWKMNGLVASLDELQALIGALLERPAATRVAVCPPATLLSRLAVAAGAASVEVGGQDCHAEPSGAFTGDVSAEMLRDAGATLVILGHSERRAGHLETDALVANKVEAALRAGLEPIVCVGETLAQREAGQEVEVVRSQVTASLPDALAGRAFAVAYEPVWAIGTGLTPTLEQIAQVHQAIRAAMAERFGAFGSTVPILYGGSVNAANAAEILAVPEVGGALVGGASLKADSFLGIIRAA